MKRYLMTFATTVLVSSLILAACSSGGNSGDAPKTTGDSGAAASQSNTGPVKIKVFAQANPDNDLANNEFTKTVEQKFNIKLDWQVVPFNGAAEKRQISLASGDYSDVYMMIPWVDAFSQTDLLRFSKQGVILPLNDLIAKYAPNIKAALDKYPYYKAANTSPDGNIYGLGQMNECYHCSYPNKLWINSKWLKKLNLEVPKTTDDMKKVLEAFKTKDPNGNGKADEVPLSGSTEDYGVRIIPYFMNGFIYDDDRTYLNINNSKVELAATKPEWKEGLTYLKSLFDEKLIDVGGFSQNAEALKKIGDNASAQILGAATAMHPYIFVSPNADDKSKDYSKDYDAISPLQGPHAAYSTFNNPYESLGTFVLTNKASKDVQIAAIKMLDYLFTTEGQLLGNFGVEGENWRKPQDGDVAVEKSAKPIFAQIPSKQGDKPHYTNWGATAQYFQPKDFRNGNVQATDIYDRTGYERRLQEATHLYDGKQPKDVFPHWAVWIDPSVADEAAMLKKNIKDYIDQNALQFIMGSKDLNKDWDAYVAGLDKLNLKRYLEIMQKAYDGFKK